MMNREKVIVRTSIIGILANAFLAAFKAGVGLLSNSISIVLDAVNNLSDALSSVITIVGAKLSNRPADKKHPLGHGRIEFLTAVAIAVLVLYAGVTSLIESIKKIISPETADYSAVGLIIIAVAVLVKVVLGLYVQKTGKRVNSDALINSGKDALMDSIISLSTLVAAGIYLIFGVSLEAYLGVIISLIIIKAGFDMLREGLSDIIGIRVDSELSTGVKEALCEHEEVKGAFDLILHSYGPDKLIGSVHIEVRGDMTAVELDNLERKLQADIYERFGVILTGVSVYAVDLDDEETDTLFHQVHDTVMAYDHVLQIHGFNLDKESKVVIFDMIIDFEVKDRNALCNEIVERIEQEHPGYTFYVTLDSDISD